MRICSVCLRPTRGEPVHAGCQKPDAYRSLLHKRMSAVFRINNAPCTECGAFHTEANPITAHHEEPLARRRVQRADRPEDYVPLCRLCNSVRGSKVGTE
jgi:hypothetical protein